MNQGGQCHPWWGFNPQPLEALFWLTSRQACLIPKRILLKKLIKKNIRRLQKSHKNKLVEQTLPVSAVWEMVPKTLSATLLTLTYWYSPSCAEYFYELTPLIS